MSKSLDRGLQEVGYFLSRLGVDKPPVQLKVSSWAEAYARFYATFGGNKTENEFRNSLKNLRDHFDSHLPNSRTGWMNGKNQPQQLSNSNRQVFEELGRLNEEELWQRIRPYAVLSYNLELAEQKNLIVSEKGVSYFSSEFSGERKIAARPGNVTFVQHGFVVDSLFEYAKKMYPSCCVFNTQKIDLAVEFENQLKAIFEVKTSADSQSIYTAVGQLFMHSVGAIDACKWIVLPDEVKMNSDLMGSLSALNIKVVCYTLVDNACFFEVV